MSTMTRMRLHSAVCSAENLDGKVMLNLIVRKHEQTHMSETLTALLRVLTQGMAVLPKVTTK